jgi:hypothetical protein
MSFLQFLVWNCTYFVAVVDVLIKVGKRHVQPDVTTTQARTLNPPSFYTPSYCKNDINPPNRKIYVFINKRVKNVTVQEFSSSQSVPITTDVVSSNLDHDEVYNIM